MNNWGLSYRFSAAETLCQRKIYYLSRREVLSNNKRIMGTVLRNSECRVLEFRVNNSFKVTQFICRIETETAC